MKKLILLFVFVMALAGCSGAENVPDGGEQLPVNNETEKATTNYSEGRYGEFVLRLETIKSSYATGEALGIKAMLKYDGDKQSELIYHSMHAVAIGVSEKTRGIDIGYVMEQPLLTTEMKKGEWLEFPYVKQAVYSEEDVNKAFIEQFLKGEGLPEGEYAFTAIADFYTKKGEEQIQHSFKVEKMIAVHGDES
ncbi:hypothetical protein [Paenibacillus sp. NEAU-GSW1]|uniref:hypothetical protein n=1 Tax=Paenibacillus sp. NEAU-GSW1 TaxID=2682486 RepID=UPI0012E288C5|nr:hypothetical protein [Paenibacillus sp. NEAU-GSW1]MUT67859.1 hypothetical protein [Paenibacillus sp. NEAU-GSW1]